MLSGPELALLLLWATIRTTSPGRACLCTSLRPAGLRVNCTSHGLLALPPLPPDTTELLVQDSGLATIPAGLFDGLAGLQSVSLSGNPFHCDCGIEYLRNWLLRNRDAVSQEPACSSPASVAQKAVRDLTDDYFSQCAPRGCYSTPYVIIVGVLLCSLVALLLWSLRLAKNCTFTLNIEGNHSALHADALRPLRARHSRRLSVSADRHRLIEDLQRLPVSMELLPQVLDVLHKKHNIKIKVI